MVDVLQCQIRDGCSQADFVKQMSKIVATEKNNEESKEINTNREAAFELDLEKVGSDGFNLLHVACGSGHIEIVKWLLKIKRVNPNTKGIDGWTALEIAATSGVLEIVQLLLADKRIQFLSGSERGSALHLAA